MTIAAAFAPLVADIGSFLPVLFIIYVVYAIFSSIAKVARQAAQAQKAANAPSTAQPDQAQPTLADVRAALERRMAAVAAARAQAVQASQAAPVAQSVPAGRPGLVAPRPVAMPQPPAVVSVSSSAAMPMLATPGDMFQPQALADTAIGAAPAGVSLTSLLASLPLAAQAVVASSVIGPCASHRGGGHDPEDW